MSSACAQSGGVRNPKALKLERALLCLGSRDDRSMHESRGALPHILQKLASFWCAGILSRLLFPV